MREVKIGKLYKHFKGGIYQVTDIALHTEDNSCLVIYRSVENGKVFARPIDMFMSEVDKSKYLDVIQRYRFEEYEEDETNIAVMPTNFDNWRVLEVTYDVDLAETLNPEVAYREIISCIVDELVHSLYIPFRSYALPDKNMERFNIRIPVGPWINMLK